jgi:hypothetical protein
MNGRFQIQEGKNWILPKEINANRFFWDSHWLEIWSNHLFSSMGPNGWIVAMVSVHHIGHGPSIPGHVVGSGPGCHVGNCIHWHKHH